MHVSCIISFVCNLFIYVDTGRGLMALKYFKPGDVIISLPEKLLITSGSILNSSVGQVMCRFVKKCGGP